MLHRVVILLLFLCFSLGARSQLVIRTIAGDGTPSFSGDNGPASAARLNNPHGVAVDPAGNIYFTDYGNNRIRKISTTGIITTIAGTGAPGYSGDGGPATAADLYGPRGITADGAGNVYFSDYVNHRIRKITPSGIITTVAGNGFGGFSGDGGPATAAQLKYAWGIAVDGSGNLYIADQNNCRLRKVTPSGIISTIAGTGSCFIGGDGGPASSALLQYPLGVVCDAAGNIFIADYGNNRIRKIDASGTITTIAGSPVYGFSGDGGPSTASQLYYPMGIGIDDTGNLYICDVNNNRIRKINTAGTINTIAGNGTAGFSGDGGPPLYAQIDRATGVAVSSTGKIYIADNNNNRIRVLEPPANAPLFIMGHHQAVFGCNAAPVDLDTFLAVFDIDTGQTETWSIVSPPLNGTLSAAYTATSTGDTLYPSGLTYTCPGTFIGMDIFEVRITDGTYSDTTMVHMMIVGMPDAGTLAGVDSMCPREYYTFTSTAPGGSWYSDSTAYATVDADGIVTAVSPGTTFIRYVMENRCGSDTAIRTLLIRSEGCPPEEVEPMSFRGSNLHIVPNPSRGNFSLQLSLPVPQQVVFRITDVAGRTVKEIAAPANILVPVDLPLAPGVYFISAAAAQGTWNSKIIVQ